MNVDLQNPKADANEALKGIKTSSVPHEVHYWARDAVWDEDEPVSTSSELADSQSPTTTDVAGQVPSWDEVESSIPCRICGALLTTNDTDQMNHYEACLKQHDPDNCPFCDASFGDKCHLHMSAHVKECGFGVEDRSEDCDDEYCPHGPDERAAVQDWMSSPFNPNRKAPWWHLTPALEGLRKSAEGQLRVCMDPSVFFNREKLHVLFMVLGSPRAEVRRVARHARLLRLLMRLRKRIFSAVKLSSSPSIGRMRSATKIELRISSKTSNLLSSQWRRSSLV